MDHLRPFQRLDSLRTGDDKEGGISTREEMEGSSIDLGPDPELSYDERVIIDKKLVRKLDWTLIPWLCLLYLMAFLDRTNIGNAKIDHLTESLNLSNKGYNAALTIFFASYAFFEPLTNVLLKLWSPRRFIPSIMILWGLIMTVMGFVKNWSGLMACRWFLGFTEAGLFPGVNYYLSCWYCRDEFGIRAAIFFSAAAVSGSFGGLLAAAINKMDKMRGFRGWSWIFFIEGGLTVLIGIASFWVVQNFPDKAKFLTEKDRARVLYRLKLDHQASSGPEEFDTKYVKQAYHDYKMYLAMFIYAGADMSLYAFALYLPSIVNEMGYSITMSQLLTVPPYFVAALFTILIGYIADRSGQRGYCNIVCAPIAVIGFIILLAVPEDNHGVKYFACFLGAMGIYPCISNTISWISNNIEGVYKRGVVLGMTIGFGNMNGIVSSNIFQGNPGKTGYIVLIVYLSVCLTGGSILMRFALARENQLRRKGGRDYWIRGKTEADIAKLGDCRPDFLYTL